MTSEDFSARDAPIRVNSYTTVLRRPGVPHKLFAHYWRDVHGPLCARLPGLGWYVQHHFAREKNAHLWPVLDGVGPLEVYVLDGMVEIGFDGPASQAEFNAASPVLFADEQNMFAETLAYDLPQGSRTLIDRLPDPIPNGADGIDRVHLHLSARHHGLSGFRSFVGNELAPCIASCPSVLKLRLHLPEPHEAAAQNPPSPGVAHAASRRRVGMAMLEIAFPDPLARRSFLASPAFRATAAGQLEHVGNATAFGVSGVFTYVRDGALTTAGLRGSRAAELIRRVGALNQLTPEVARLMQTGRLDPMHPS